MAGWALALSLLPCFTPVGQLVALGLAIAVLVKSRDGRDHGRGMAVAGLVISILVLVAIVAYVVITVVSYWKDGWDETERDADGRVTEAGLVSIDRLRVARLREPTRAETRAEEGLSGLRCAPVAEPATSAHLRPR